MNDFGRQHIDLVTASASLHNANSKKRKEPITSFLNFICSDVGNELQHAALDLRLDHMWATNGNHILYVKASVADHDHIFHTFTISNTQDLDADSEDHEAVLQYQEIQFIPKSISDQEKFEQLPFYHSLMYNNSKLYLFLGSNKNTISHVAVYDCNNFDWNLKKLAPKNIINKLHNHDQNQNFLFANYLNYAFFIVCDINKQPAIEIYSINIETMIVTRKIDANTSSNSNISNSGGYSDISVGILLANENISEPDAIACTVVKDHYLLLVDGIYGDIYLIDINDIISNKIQDRTINYIKIGSLQSYFPQGINRKRSKDMYFIGNNCNLFICDSKCRIKILCKLYDESSRNCMDIIALPVDDNNDDGDDNDGDDVGNYKDEKRERDMSRSIGSLDIDMKSSKVSMGDLPELLDIVPERYCVVLVGKKIIVLHHNVGRRKGNVSEVYVSCSNWNNEIVRRSRYSISKRKIGLGGSSQVYLGRRLSDNKAIVIKQMDDGKDLDCNIEEEIYSKLKVNNLSWISCDFYECVIENKRKYLVFEKLGVSLQHLMNENINYNYGGGVGTLSLSHVLGILDRMIIILCKLHSIGYVHNDIKPENILIGNKEDDLRSNQLYLIDFGIATPFWDFDNNEHLPIKTGVSFNGTFRFASKNLHCYTYSTSRRDDLESLIYLAIYCLTGTLPWILTNTNKHYNSSCKQHILEETKAKKVNAEIDTICHGIPNEFKQALTHIESLDYDEMPDYLFLQQLFRQLHQKTMQTQLISPSKLLNIQTQRNGDSDNKENAHTNAANTVNYNAETIDKHIVSITSFESGVDVKLDFLGSYIPIATKTETSPSKNSINSNNGNNSSIDATDNNKNDNHNINYNGASKDSKGQIRDHDSWISRKLTDIAETQLNRMVKNSTITNHPTHMSVNGMRNRSGYLIDLITIGKGVPYKAPTKATEQYAGIIIYRAKSMFDQENVIGEIYMLPSSKCKEINKDYKQKHRRKEPLPGIVHGAIYYYYFKENPKLSPKTGLQRISLTRGFSYSPNEQLKCRSRCFNFTGFNLQDDKYKPLAKCEEEFIDCTLKRYWDNNTQIQTTFQQFMQRGRRRSRSSLRARANAKTRRKISENWKLEVLDEIVEEKSDEIDLVMDEIPEIELQPQLVPEYSDYDIEIKPLQMYSKVDLCNSDVSRIIDFLSDKDKLSLFIVSKQSRLLMNRYCVTKSQARLLPLECSKSKLPKSPKSGSPQWYRICKISTNVVHKKGKKEKEIIIKIKPPNHTNKSTVDLRNWKYEYNSGGTKSKNINFVENKHVQAMVNPDPINITTTCTNSVSEHLKFVFVNYHPLVEMICDNDKQLKDLHRMYDDDENLKFLLLLKHFGIYDFTKYITYQAISYEISVNGTRKRYEWQPEWSYQRKGKWMPYDAGAVCTQIEDAYQDGSESVMLSEGKYSKSEWSKLYKILFCCSYLGLNASNQDNVDDIDNNVKWKENMFCKYFYQQNVENKWVRIVRRKMVLKEKNKSYLNVKSMRALLSQLR